MSKPPVILFGDFTLDEATHFQQLESTSEVEGQGAPDTSANDGPPFVRFGSVDPTVHIAHSPPPLPPTAAAHPPYSHHPPPYIAGNHPPHYLQNIPPPHFGPHRPFYPAPYYTSSFGTFPHLGGPPLPYAPEYLYGRPILPPPHPYPGPVDPSHPLPGMSTAPLGVVPPASAGWRPHPLASPPLQPDRAPLAPAGLPDFPPAHQPSWNPPTAHFPPDMPPFHQQRPQSPGGYSAAAPHEGRPHQVEEVASERLEEPSAPAEGAVHSQPGSMHEDGAKAHEGPADATPREAVESPQPLAPPEEQEHQPRPQAEEDEQTAPTGWGQTSSGGSTEVAVASEGSADDAAAPPAEPKPSPASPTPTPAAAVAPKPKSWAALVGKQAGQVGVPYQVAQPAVSRTSYVAPTSHERAPVAKGGAKPQLSGPAWTRMLRDSASLRLQPRGLVNTGNSCFLNATLQALFACPPFLLLVNQLKTCALDQDEYPMLYALVSYLAQFDPLPSAPVKPAPGGGVDVGSPFSPDMFVDVLQRFSPNTQHRGLRRARQEDAQEFLSYVMDRMHEELLKLESAPAGAPPAPKASNGPALPNGAGAVAGGEGDDEWETVGPKNKSAVTRMHTHADSALSSIFGGSLQSLVKTKGTKASATVQPFTIVQLDIASDVVRSVEDALQLFAAPETLDGYRPSGRAEVAASKLLKLGMLPRVLVLHLMRFSFSGDRGPTKVHKPVKFPPTLTIPIKLLTAPPAPAELRRYELVATVSHIGKDPSGGHYTADARQEDGRWLRFDDSTVSVVNLNRVLHDQAYLLLYKRVVQ